MYTRFSLPPLANMLLLSDHFNPQTSSPCASTRDTTLFAALTENKHELIAKQDKNTSIFYKNKPSK